MGSQKNGWTGYYSYYQNILLSEHTVSVQCAMAVTVLCSLPSTQESLGKVLVRTMPKDKMLEEEE